MAGKRQSYEHGKSADHHGHLWRLTPAHHLRGAAQNRDLSAKVGQIPARGKSVAAPRLVHALVRRHQLWYGVPALPVCSCLRVLLNPVLNDDDQWPSRGVRLDPATNAY